MSRIKKQFLGKTKVLSVFVTAGYPNIDSLYELLPSLEEAGVQMVEVGIPFSDPLADGETIQRTSNIALRNGMTLKLIFEQLKAIIPRLNIPIILMGYLNPVLHFGVEEFYKNCKEVGVSGVIIPDIPLAELQCYYLVYSKRYEIPHILMVTPTTPIHRVRLIDDLSDGFIYAVSTSSTTGSNDVENKIDVDHLKVIQSLHLKNPLMVGFGINSSKAFEIACRYANGAIVGTAFLRSIAKCNSNLNEAVSKFVSSIKPKTL